MSISLDYTSLGKDFAAFVVDPTSETSIEYANKMGLKVSHTQDIRGHRYHIVRYDKSKYSTNDTETTETTETMDNDANEANATNEKLVMNDNIAMLRSIIISDGKIRCVSLPKATRTLEQRPTDANLSFMLEGPMINTFYYADEDCSGDDFHGKGWQITTRSVFGARNSYFDDEDGNQMSFREMFLEAMDENFIETHDRNSCYSFVVRHPKNRDVYSVEKPSLVRVATFTPRDDTNMIWDYVGPDQEEMKNYAEYSIGSTASWSENGRLVRSKSLHDNYKELRMLRGTQPKLKFHYLTLRKRRGGISQYLSHFTEHSKIFSVYREQIHEFTKQLQNNYWDCYVRHNKPLREYDGRYKQHMFNLHSSFKENRKPMLISEVIKYVNSLSPAQLMFSLNFEHRPKRTKQTQNQNSDASNTMENDNNDNNDTTDTTE